MSGGGNEGSKVENELTDGKVKNHQVRIALPMKSKREILELKRKLEAERDIVRSLMSRIESNEAQKNGTHNTDRSPQTLTPSNRKTNTGNVDKEKSPPDAEDRVPPAESKTKSKSNQVFKNCKTLLEKLLKYKHAWVFGKPVDAVALGLHDYFEIIKNPMDLGTVKNRLTRTWYKSPVDFAEDVRLTFRNAMTYNPKGQDVYVIAEQMSKMFEDKWASIEAELKLDMEINVGVSESMRKRKTSDIARCSKVSKKPKAKDLTKRDMTYDEKHKLSVDLQNLPSEKLENVVRIIKKMDPSVSQQDDEIEVDIDSFDNETLWELDRFITYYKKSLSKCTKRKAEIISHLIIDPQQNTVEKVTEAVVTKTGKENMTSEERLVSPPVEAEEPRRDDTNPNQSSSSSDSGSSSSAVDESHSDK